MPYRIALLTNNQNPPVLLRCLHRMKLNVLSTPKRSVSPSINYLHTISQHGGNQWGNHPLPLLHGVFMLCPSTTKGPLHLTSKRSSKVHRLWFWPLSRKKNGIAGGWWWWRENGIDNCSNTEKGALRMWGVHDREAWVEKFLFFLA